MAKPVVNIGGIVLVFLLSLFAKLYFSQLEAAAFLCVSYMVYTAVKAVVTDNYSQVDMCWNFTPIFYSFHLSHWTARGFIMFALVAAWGLRLAYNFYRKGGYSGGEDYRWEEIKKIIGNPILWQLFNFFFNSILENTLLILVCLPLYYENQEPLSFRDYLLTLITALLLVLEAVADQQQWDFQTEKARKIKNGEKPKIGFLTTGLFRYSRHPNFFAEVSFWWCLYFFTYSLNISIIGTVWYILQFHASTDFTEKLSASKYPEYKDYQRTTSRIIPWFPSPLEKTT